MWGTNTCLNTHPWTQEHIYDPPLLSLAPEVKHFCTFAQLAHSMPCQGRGTILHMLVFIDRQNRVMGTSRGALHTLSGCTFLTLKVYHCNWSESARVRCVYFIDANITHPRYCRQFHHALCAMCLSFTNTSQYVFPF